MSLALEQIDEPFAQIIWRPQDDLFCVEWDVNKDDLNQSSN